MPDGLHRTQHQADGSRIVQKYTGADLTFASPGWDAAHNWEDVMTLQPGQVATDFAAVTGDLTAGELADGNGVPLNIAGTHFVVPVEMAEGFIATLTAAVAKAKANQAAHKAQQGQAQP